MYVHSATSHGATDNDVLHMILGYPQKSIYNSLNEANKSWKIYYEMISSAMVFSKLRNKNDLKKFLLMD